MSPRQPREKRKRVVSVLIVSSLPIFLEGMRWILSDDPHIRILGEAHGLREAIDKVMGLHPDVALLDFPTTNKRVLDAIHRMKALDRKLRILVLSSTGTLAPSARYYTAGATDVILPGTRLPQLFRLIHGEDMPHRKHVPSAAA
jgi:DNA-binding NarL/FixJ family response regulator